jgi:hypothetical protein
MRHCDRKMLRNAGPLHFLHTCQGLPHEHRECFVAGAPLIPVGLAKTIKFESALIEDR